MKSNAILRIVLHSIAITLLVTALCGALIGCNITIDTGFEGTQNLGNGSVVAADIKNINIEWISGKIKIQAADTTQITFSESSDYEKAKPMQWKQKGDTLVIMFDKENQINFGIGLDSAVSWDKDLTVTVPTNWNMGEIEIESVSAELTMDSIQASELSIETVSGKTNVTNCLIDNISLNTVSGHGNISADFREMDIEAVSANCRVYSMGNPQSIELNGVSGNLELYLLEEVGFTYESDSLSGSFSCSFPTTSNGDKQVYGNGSCRIESECISGTIKILKAE